MGNCQAVDAAALVIQHPSGKIERMYWSITAGEIMKMNPGHYVSLIIPLPGDDGSGNKTVRFTRVKLLRPTDTLVLGRAYRLVSSHEVMKVLRAKRQSKTNKERSEIMESHGEEQTSSQLESSSQAMAYDRSIKQRSGSFSKSKTWRPSLQSISEASSATASA
ncbi:uncharacterized protein LOC143601366 [Bidens hawaiensis]|uniref:uncharacterized protein LOC143601366 n=1 Tax=Bidens hawaiensis TaxID=980011 RepID=UPI00404B98C1